MNNTIIEKRQLVTFYELPTIWQSQALSNFDDIESAELATYILPRDFEDPSIHILYDLDDAVYIGTNKICLPISNAISLTINLITDTECELVYNL